MDLKERLPRHKKKASDGLKCWGGFEKLTADILNILEKKRNKKRQKEDALDTAAGGLSGTSPLLESEPWD